MSDSKSDPNKPFDDNTIRDDAWSGDDPNLPEKVGRYLVMDLLGEGGFSWVYRAFDSELQRPVALKVLRPHMSRELKLLDQTFVEAQILANLRRHKGIVQVYDVERTENDGICIVYELIEGESLAERMARESVPRQEALDWLKDVCHALHHVHKHGLVHRDIKPGNIMLDASGHPVLIDFGLATASELERNLGRGISGTPSYMSPEQARGENHLVDGRSDIFSLGIVFHELLIGKLPFEGSDERSVLKKIKTTETRPLRLFDHTVPAELERICMKSLSPKLNDRYVIALDMAKDLEAFVDDGFSATVAPTATPTASTVESSDSTTWDAATKTFTPGNAPVVPKGLRSFGVEDKEFFLTLLPGVRNRLGIPESVDYWVSRIHETSTETPFRVGLIYGPSGSGKSSFVHGGIVPLLESNVTAISIEGDRALSRNILRNVWKRYPELEGDEQLPRIFRTLRQYTMPETSGKLLVVVDQFEQWLHANPSTEDRLELVQAFRQCDGQHLQAIFLIRDDFWLGISQFMDDLEVEMSPRKNCMFLDLFDHRHARKVLGKFGRAYGALPPPPESLPTHSERFIKKAVEDLSVEEKVAPVRLALFADMLKGQAWTPDTLRSAGGADGLGVKFLEQAFDKQSSDPAHKQFSKAARKILSELLPDDLDVGIKGSAKSETHLREAARMRNKDDLFQRLLRMLDQDLRLITPMDSLGNDETASPEKSYQLTHDFLVAPVRDWLTKHLLSTRRGRLQVHLDNLTRVWKSSQPRRVLPSVWEWAGISLLFRRKNWGRDARAMMRQAGISHGLRLAAISATIFILWWSVNHFARKNRSETYVDTLLHAAPEQAGTFLANDSRELPGVLAICKRKLASGNLNHRQELLTRILLQPKDTRQTEILGEMLYDEKTGPLELGVLLDSLPKQRLVNAALDRLIDAEESPAARLRAACAISTEPAVVEKDPIIQETDWQNIGLILLRESARDATGWALLLKPLRENLSGVLEEHLLREVPARKREVAALVLTQFFEGDALTLEHLLTKLEPTEVRQVYNAIRQCSDGDELLMRVVDSANKAGMTISDEARKTGNAALALALSGEMEPVLPLLRKSEDPTVRTYILHGLGPSGCNRDLIVESLRQPREGEDGAFVTSALVLSLSEFDDVQLPAELRTQIQPLLEQWLANHPSCGVRSASRWVLRQWNPDREFPVKPTPPLPGRDWWVTENGLTMRILEDGDHRFAISTTEVTENVYRGLAKHLQSPEIDPLWKDTWPNTFEFLTNEYPASSYPVNNLYVIQAMIFCRWLSELDDIPSDEMFYPPIETLIPLMNNQLKSSMAVLEDWLDGTTNPNLHRAGYRLPTTAEWVLACAGGAKTVDNFIGGRAVLPHFDKYVWSSNKPGEFNNVGTRIPNPYGFFDMLGNVSEWCHTIQPAANEPDHSEIGCVRKGGNYSSSGEDFTFHHWASLTSTFRSDAFGFRIARTLGEPEK